MNHLQESIQQTKIDIASMQEEIEAIQYAVRDFYSLEGAFEGQAGDAIRHFYQDTHEPFLIFFQQSLSDYQAALEKISEAVFSYESNPSGYVRQDYLESDVPQGLQRAGDEAQQLTAEAQAIINSISDLVSIPAFDESGVMDAVQAGKRQADESIQGLVELDRQGVAHLENTQSDLDKMNAFLSDMESTFSSKQSLTNYTVSSIQNMKSYRELTEGITMGTDSIEKALYGGNLDELTLAEIERGKHLISTSLSKGGREALNHAFIQLKNGQISRANYTTILQKQLGLAIRKGLVDNDVRQGFNNFWDNNKEDLPEEIADLALGGASALFSKWSRDIVVDAGIFGPKGTNQFVITSSVSSEVRAQAAEVAKGAQAFKWAGRGLAAYGTWTEYAEHVDSGHTQGEAITRTAGSFTAAKIGSVATTAALTFLVGGTPVGWTAAGIAIASGAVGWGASKRFNSAYESNEYGVRTKVDKVGYLLDSAGEAVVSKAKAGINWLGEQIDTVNETIDKNIDTGAEIIVNEVEKVKLGVANKVGQIGSNLINSTGQSIQRKIEEQILPNRPLHSIIY